MMPIYKPEKINGQVVGKPYTRESDGIMRKLESTSVLHPPSVSVIEFKQPLGLIVEQEAVAIVGLKAMTTSELRNRLHAFALRVIDNHRRPTRG